MTKKKNANIMGYGKTTDATVTIGDVEFEIPIYTGAVIVDNLDRAKEVLTMMENAQDAIQPIQDFIAEARKQTTEYARTRDQNVIQLAGRYWRKVQRFSKMWVATDADMPTPKPRGAKSLREICKGKKAGDKPLWNFITRRVPDAALIDLAVKKGYVTEKEIGKALVERPQAAFLQRFEGEAVEGEEGDG